MYERCDWPSFASMSSIILMTLRKLYAVSTKIKRLASSTATTWLNGPMSFFTLGAKVSAFTASSG